MNASFVAQVIEALKTRLLTIGRSSSLILSFYIKTIDVMKLLDPSTLMLEEVSDAFKKFLKFLLPVDFAPDGLVQLLSTEYKFAVSFIILVLVLLMRPSGILRGRVL